MDIVINGLHRSGTTLLSRLINALPETFIIKDGLRFPYYHIRVESTAGKPDDRIGYPYGMYRDPRLALDLNREVKDISSLTRILLKEVAAYRLEPGLEASLVEWLARLDQGCSYHDVLTELFEIIRAGTGCRSAGVKSTHMVSFAQVLLSAYPELKWIEIIRDPSGWYCSSKVSHSQKLIKGMRLWNNEVAASLAAAHLYPERFLVITYEDLILDNINTFQQICGFLNIDCRVTDEWLGELDLVENDGRQWFVNSSYIRDGGTIPGAQNRRIASDYQTFDPHPVHRWRAILSFREKAIIKQLTGWNRSRLAAFRNSSTGLNG